MSLPGIVIQIGADTKDAIDGINRVNSHLGNSLSGAEKFKAGLDKAFVPALGVLGALGGAAVLFSKAAAEDAQQAGILAQALRNTAGASDAQIASTEAWITAQGKALGFADDKLRPALGVLARATGDVAQAQDLAATAMDISVATGSDLESVSKALAKATAGSTTSLGKLVPGLDKAILASGDMAAIQAELARVVGGSATTAANSAAGQMQRFQLALSETGESIGAALLPILQTLLPYLQQFGAWAQANTPLLIAIGAAVAAVAATIIILKIAMEAWTVVQWALNSALLANPITWIVIAIIAFVAAIVLAYNKVEWFRNFVDAAWAAIQAAVSVVVDWFVTNVLPTLQTVWAGIQAAIATVADWFRDTAWPIIETVIGWIKTYFTTYLAAVGVVWEVLQAGIRGVVQWFRDTAWPIIETVIGWIKTYFADKLALAAAAWQLLQAGIKVVLDWITTTLVPAITTQVTLIRDAFDTALAFITGLWNTFTTFLGGLVTTFTTIGGNIVQGIKDGFSAPWNAFMGWVQEQINKLPDVAKQVLGIASPSRVFRNLGEQVVAGWAEGLSGMASVNAQVAAGASDLVVGLDTNLGSGSGSRSSSASAGATVHVTEEQIARAIYAVLLRSDGRNGRVTAVA